MTQATLCRLCINICKEYKVLYDDTGACNEIYETTVKYFDPMFLSLEQVKQPVICVDCWRHIDDFHHFQLSVIVAQSKLNEYVVNQNTDETVVKSEDEMDAFDQTLESGVETVEEPFNANIGIFNDNNASDDDEDDKNDFALPDIELLEEHPIQDEFISDDEKPLLECLGKMRKTRAQKKRVTTMNEVIKVPKKRGRKPKTEAAKSSCSPKKKSKKSETLNCGDLSPKEDNSNIKDNYSSHDENDEDKCSDGNTVSRTSKEIDDYIAQWKQDLECYVCSQTSKSMHLLRQHFRREHPKTRCYVVCCQRKLSRRHQLEEHIRFHVDPAAFKCQLCGKCCTNKRTLSNHMYEQHTEEGQQRSYECPICQKRFAKKPVWKRHMEIHETSKDFVCQQCGKGFPTEQRRNVHERMVHNSDHVCDQCGKTIHGIYALRQHVLEHAGVEKRKWSCDQCNAKLNTHASLKRHKEVAHHDGSTAYICSECGKVSATAVALRSHKKYVHLAKRKFQCTLCDKAFKTNIGLREHMATHTGEDLYTCPHCPRTFKVNSNMHHHRKKAHPKEWAEARMNRPVMPIIDVNQVTQEVVI